MTRSIHLTDEHEAFRARVRARFAEHVVPHLADWETDRRVPREVWKLLGSWGYLELPHTGGDPFRSTVFLEELGRTGYSGFRAAVSVHAYMATQYLTHASAEQRAHWLPSAVTGDAVWALAITEPGAGSDLRSLRTTATVADTVTLTGTKSTITNGTTADVYVVAARTGPNSLTLVLVEAGTPGLTATPAFTGSWGAADTATVEFAGVEVPAANVLGRRGNGLYHLMRSLTAERVTAAALALGGVEAVLEHAVEHVRARHAHGGPLARLQSVRHTLATLHTELAAARHLLYDTTWRAITDLPMAEAAMTKAHCTELALRTATECLHLFGAAAQSPGHPVWRAALEAPAATIAAGPTETMLDLVATAVLDAPPGRS